MKIRNKHHGCLEDMKQTIKKVGIRMSPFLPKSASKSSLQEVPNRNILRNSWEDEKNNLLQVLIGVHTTPNEQLIHHFSPTGKHTNNVHRIHPMHGRIAINLTVYKTKDI